LEVGRPVGALEVGLPVGDMVAVLVGLPVIDGLNVGNTVVGAAETGGFVGIPQLSTQTDLSLQ